jgi:hypothetical protein
MPTSEPITTTGAVLAYFAGAALVGGSAWLGATFGGPMLWPLPIMMVVPIWLLGWTIDTGPSVILLLGAVPFLLVGIPLAVPKSQAVWPTLVFTSVLVLASIGYFSVAWSDGVKWQGFTYTVTVGLINVVFAGLCLLFVLRAVRRRTFFNRYVAVLGPSMWFSWYAFPWLGGTT